MSNQNIKPNFPLLNDLPQRVNKKAIANLSSEKKKRLSNGLTGDMFVYPIEPSVYRVLSFKKEKVSKYVVSVINVPICECRDFVFNCVKEKAWCKHIFRVWAEINVGELPPLGINPAQWLRNKLQKVVFHMMDASSTDKAKAEDIKKVYRELNRTFPDEKYFRKGMFLWRKYRNTLPEEYDGK